MTWMFIISTTVWVNGWDTSSVASRARSELTSSQCNWKGNQKGKGTDETPKRLNKNHHSGIELVDKMISQLEDMKQPIVAAISQDIVKIYSILDWMKKMSNMSWIHWVSNFLFVVNPLCPTTEKGQSRLFWLATPLYTMVCCARISDWNLEIVQCLLARTQARTLSYYSCYSLVRVH